MRFEIVVKNPAPWVRKFLEITLSNVLEIFVIIGGKPEDISGAVIVEE